jgi:hypothetical protein
MPCSSVTARSVANVAALVLLLVNAGKLVAQPPATSAPSTVFHLLDATIDDVHVRGEP